MSDTPKGAATTADDIKTKDGKDEPKVPGATNAPQNVPPQTLKPQPDKAPACMGPVDKMGTEPHRPHRGTPDQTADMRQRWEDATDWIAAGVTKLHAAGMDTAAAGTLCLELFETMFVAPHHDD